MRNEDGFKPQKKIQIRPLIAGKPYTVYDTFFKNKRKSLRLNTAFDIGKVCQGFGSPLEILYWRSNQFYLQINCALNKGKSSLSVFIRGKDNDLVSKPTNKDNKVLC